MFRKQVLGLGFVLACLVSAAQNMGTVNGVVSDSSGKPVDAVTITIKENPRYTTTTDKNGYFEMQIPANVQQTLVFSSINIFPAELIVVVDADETIKGIKQKVGLKQFNFPEANITGQRAVDSVIPGTSRVYSQQFSASPQESFEGTLAAQALGVSKTNELSSTYSVRGGSFDENLVYVNDFEIYRPFLIRSAQQEGLSFVNPDMVDNVQFSSGGFQAKYGDKMSSVMDVTYRRPDSIHGSLYASLLGFGGHLEGSDNKRRFGFSVGVRQRLSQYLLNTLDTRGTYNPNFLDVQALLTYRINEKWGLEALVNYTRNQFIFQPVDRTTTFGLLTDVKELQVYYDGQEIDQYQSTTDGLSLVYKPNDDLRIKFLGSFMQDNEKQTYDIDGQYYLSEVNSNIGSSTYGQTLYSLGTGGIENWARDFLNIHVYTAAMRGTWYKGRHNLQWGADYKREVVADQISEWTLLDSAGYSVPYTGTSVNLSSVLKSMFNLKSDRTTAFIQDSWKFGKDTKFTWNYGARFEYWDVNKEPIFTPRTQFSIKPKGKKDIVVYVATGLYYQPPFYREMRNDFTGVVNTSMLAQKSYHVTAGFSYSFLAWHRPFNFTAEAYYKLLWDLDPYQYNDVNIQYEGNNSAKGYTYGLDMRLNGELAKGLQSWISMSVMQAEERIPGLTYEAYYDTAGQQIALNPENASIFKDSVKVKTGKFPMPTDQRVNFNLYFQDNIPQWPFITLHINLVFATGLPFGPPTNTIYEDVFRMPPYRRVDMGFTGQVWNPKWAKRRNKFNQGLKGAWISLDVFNIFGIQNVVSYLWVSDYAGDQFAVPNYLTNRLVNVKFLVNF